MKTRKVIIAVAMTVVLNIFSACTSEAKAGLISKTTTTTTTTTKVEANEPIETTEKVEEESETKAEESDNSEVQYDSGFKDLPEPIMEKVNYWKSIYPNMDIGVGLYSLDGEKGYQYNADQRINSACTIKAAFSKYVLKTCEDQGIDIWSTFITFTSAHDDFGSGDIILYGTHGTDYSVGYLVYLLLSVSDNVAYNMLLDMFPLNDFYQYLYSIGGQSDWQQWGAASVTQRKNEWIDIYNYVASDTAYANTLRKDLTNTQYAYIPEGMANWHNYLHKSGWCEDDFEYPAAGDCAIIDEEYLLIILTQDYTTGSGHIDAIHSISDEVETYYYSNNGYIF